MKDKLLVLLIALFCCSSLFGQGDDRIATGTNDLSTVKQIVLPAVDNKAMYKDELAQRVPGRAPKFAHSFEVDITPETDGTWEYLDNENAVWRLVINSKDAESLNLGFSSFVMPEGGSLILYSTDYKLIRGPFTPADNEVHEQLWTPIIEHDEIVIEVQLPIDKRNELELNLSYVNHAFQSFTTAISGSCNVDVICGAADGYEMVDAYRDIIQSVAVISLGGGTFCTGFLINNARQDCTPYFMTADHCGITPQNAASLVTYWNFQNSTCREPGSGASGGNGDGTLEDFNTGSIFRSAYSPSDMTLVEMDDPISETANAFFAGWNADTVAGTSAIAVHHPSTDEKRISFEGDPVFFTSYFDDVPTEGADHVWVTSWDVGTTEGGSSGSPLFDQDKRVVGQLHGGWASCSDDRGDWYGAMATSWEGGGTPDTRLKDWLDPDDIGALVFDGRYAQACNFSVEALPPVSDLCAPETAMFDIVVSENFEMPVNISLSDIPNGLTAVLADEVVAAGGSTTLVISGTENLAPGTYVITLNGEDGMEATTSTITLNIVSDLPTIPILEMPANNMEDVATSPEFEWTGEINEEYEIEVATDMTFNNVVASTTTLETVYEDAALSEAASYFWRVRATNSCGTSDWSTVFTFTTANILCSTVEASEDLPVIIAPTPPAAYTSSLEVNANGSIEDVNVINLAGIHSWLGDLEFSLTSPEGTTIVLITSQCGFNEDFNLNLDDDGVSNLPCPYNDGGIYQSAAPLAGFNGENPQGTWILTVDDQGNQDGGELQSWGLEICSSGGVNISLASFPSSVTTCNGQGANYTLEVGTGFEAGNTSLSYTVSPNEDLGINFDIDPNMVVPGQTIAVNVPDIPSTVPSGTYDINFTISDGTNTNTTTSSLVVDIAPSSLSLLSPENDVQEVVVNNAVLSWTPLDNVVGEYIVQVAIDENFDNIIESNSTSDSQHTVETELVNNSRYYWRVIVTNSCGSAISEVFSFVTQVVDAVNELNGRTVDIQPNPTQDIVNVIFSRPFADEISVDVYSINGQLLQHRIIAGINNSIEIDLAEYSGGLYLIKLTNANASLTQRVLLQK